MATAWETRVRSGGDQAVDSYGGGSKWATEACRCRGEPGVESALEKRADTFGRIPTWTFASATRPPTFRLFELEHVLDRPEVAKSR